MSEAGDYPRMLEIKPVVGGEGVSASVRVPGSKSITNRALVLAALCSREMPCELSGALQSEDTEVMVDCLQRLGFEVETRWENERIWLRSNRSARVIPALEADLTVANSGTTMRFLTAMVALGQGRYRLDGIARMHERPIFDLLYALNQLGVHARGESRDGVPPIVVLANGLRGGRVHMRADVSSQFLSGLLMVAPFADADVDITLDGPLVSRPYIAMMLAMLTHWHLEYEWDHGRHFHIPGNQKGKCTAYTIEPDASAASYFFAAAAILGSRITVLDLPEKSLQGDVHFVDVLEQMGCRVERCSSGITVHGRPLHGVDVDMNAISDTVMTLGAVACFAKGPTIIRNVAHIRHKETDRITAIAAELGKVGATVEEFADGLKITPGPLQGAEIETYNDHRMAMSMALIGLRVPAVVIRNPGCVAKTYPGFWRDFEKTFVS